jgi:hypothetical protein
MVTNALNFALIAAELRITKGLSLNRQVRELFGPMQPAQMALGALAAMLAVAYTNFGLWTLFGLILVLLLFQSLIAALLRSEDRAEQPTHAPATTTPAGSAQHLIETWRCVTA